MIIRIMCLLETSLRTLYILRAFVGLRLQKLFYRLWYSEVEQAGREEATYQEFKAAPALLISSDKQSNIPKFDLVLLFGRRAQTLLPKITRNTN